MRISAVPIRNSLPGVDEPYPGAEISTRVKQSQRWQSCMRVGEFLERSAELLSAVAVEHPRPRSDAAIRQSDIARLVCGPGSANLSERVLDLSDVFSAIRRTGLHGRVLL